jgi:hypothetical protein
MTFRSSGSFCNPAEVQTKLARAAAFDQIAADRYFASSRLNKVGLAAGFQKKKACQISLAGPFETRQRPTFPLPHGSSSIGLGGLNFRVRDGNGCGPSGMATGNVRTEQVFTAFGCVIDEDHVYQEQRMLNRTTD